MDVEWIILADGAEVVNNKLYLLGGGWDALTINGTLPLNYPCAVAIAFTVPWREADQQQNIEIEIADEDGDELLKVPGQVEVGRPPGVPLGNAHRVQMAIRLGLPLRHTGTYAVIARIEGREARRVQFNVVSGPMPGARRESDTAP